MASLKKSYLGRFEERVGASHRKIRKRVVEAKRIACAKALRWREFGMSENLKEGQCDWIDMQWGRMRKLEKQTRARPCKAL